MHEAIILPTFGLPNHTALMIYITVVLVVLSIIFTKRATIVPGKFQCIIELFVEFFSNTVDDTMGPKGEAYKPFIYTLTLYIFISNALGLVPGLVPPTANINVPVGLALTVFVLTHIIGFKEHGFRYYKHFVGPIWALAILMVPIELVGHFARPLSLSLRLFGNMMGHEQIVNVLLRIMPYAFPLLIVYTLLGILVILIQSFIFALLSMMYFGSAMEEAH